MTLDTENSPRCDNPTIRHRGTECCKWYQVARLHIECSAPNVQLFAVTCIHIHAVHFFGVRVTLSSQHFGYNYAFDRGANGCH